MPGAEVLPAQVTGVLSTASMSTMEVEPVELVGVIQAASLTGALELGEVTFYNYPTYTGMTNVTPTGSQQTLGTAGKALLTNITIEPIPGGQVGIAQDPDTGVLIIT